MNKSDFLNKKIAITGAAGFIGSHLTERLVAEGARVKALVKYNSTSDIGWLKSLLPNDNLEIVYGDIRDPFMIRSMLEDVDTVFHLAALISIPYSYLSPQSYVDTNINGTLNILEAARFHKTNHVILTSTSEIYGTAIRVPIDEEHPLQAQSPYSASKISSDMMGKAYSCSFGLPVSIARPFNTFGPRQSLRAVIPTIIIQALKANHINLGDTRPIRDFNFVENTIDGILAVARNGDRKATAYNLATGEGISILDTVKMIGELLEKDIEIIGAPNRDRPSDSEVMRLIGCSALAKKELNWTPIKTFRQGLQQSIQWFKNNIDKYNESGRYHY